MKHLNPYLIIILIFYSSALFSQFKCEITVSSNTVCEGVDVRFTGSDSEGYDRFKWDFGDGRIDTVDIDVLVQYPPGNYTAQLTVYRGVDSLSQSTSITVFKGPSGEIELPNGDKSCAGEVVSMNAKIVPGDSPDVKTFWAFGDGKSGWGQNTQHIYRVPNVPGWPLTLKLIDGNICELEISTPMSISQTPSSSLQIDSQYCYIDSVPFIVEPATLAGVSSISWDFGDGEQGSGSSVKHSYSSSDKYGISVRIEDINGCYKVLKDSVELIMTHSEIIMDDTICLGDQYLIATQSDADYYYWQFEDGEEFYVYPYAEDTNYKLIRAGEVVLLDTNIKEFTIPDSSFRIVLKSVKDKCFTNDTHTVLVSSVKADFSVNQDYFCDFPNIVELLNTSSGAYNDLRWIFPDGDTSYLPNQNKVMKEPGNIVLEVFDPSGCVSKKELYVKKRRPKPVPEIDPSAGCIPLEVTASYNKSEPLSDFEDCTFEWLYMNQTISDTSGEWEYTQVISDDVALVMHDPECLHPDTAFFLVEVGDDPQVTIISDDSLYAYNYNTIYANTPITDSIEYLWLVDTFQITLDSFEYQLYKDTALIHPPGYFQGVYYDDWHYESYKKIYFPFIDTFFIDLYANYNGCVKHYTKRHEVQGPLVLIDTLTIESCINPLNQYIICDIYDASTVTVQFTNVRTDEQFDTTYYYASDTTFTDTIELEVTPGFYRVAFGASNSRNGKSYMMDYTKIVIYESKSKFRIDTIIQGVSDVVKASFIENDDIACYNDNIQLDYSSSENAVLFEWFKIPTATEIVNNMQILYAPFETLSDSLIIVTDSSLYERDTLANSPRASCSFSNNKPINKTLTNAIFCDRGWHHIRLMATSINSCSDTMQIDSAIRLFKPEAQLIADKSDICPGDEVTFHLEDIVEDTTITRMKLSFGNNKFFYFETGSEIATTQYYSPGLYVPIISVTDKLGCQSMNVSNIHVHMPEGTLIADDKACVNTELDFRITGNHDKYSWNFGDGTTNQNSSFLVYHTYSQGGNYDISVQIEDVFGCKNTFAKKILIEALPMFGIQALDEEEFCPIYFFEVTDTANNGVLSRTWHMINRSVDEYIAPIHSDSPKSVIPLLYAGTYDLHYTIKSDVCDQQDTTYKEIFTLGGPYMSMNDVKDMYCPNESIDLSVDMTQLLNDPIFEKWSVESHDQIIGQSEEMNAQFSVSDSGTYFINLFYTDANGCEQMDVDTIFVPQFNFDFTDPDKYCEVPTTISANIITDTNVLSYSWIFNDSVRLSNGPFIKTVNEYDEYMLSLAALSTDGCRDTVTKRVYVIQSPQINIQGGDTAICPGNSVRLLSAENDGYIYQWAPQGTLSSGFVNNPIALPSETTTYLVKVTDTLTKCISYDSTVVYIQESPASELYYRYDTLEWTLATSEEIDYPYGDSLYLKVVSEQGYLTYNWEADNVPLLCRELGLDPYLGCSQVSLVTTNEMGLTVNIRDSLGCFTEYHNLAIRPEEVYILMPTVFTPNGDGNNDYLQVLGKDIEELQELRIFDNVGTLVFKTSDISDYWDGTRNGQPLPMGTYFYYIKAKPITSKVYLEMEGAVKLIR
ncbi:MAG: PKD domain-containing protein [Bacteroidales bacterium]|nr:PKD domain-containing protein [Bacteroidales bacterium]